MFEYYNVIITKWYSPSYTLHFLSSSKSLIHISRFFIPKSRCLFFQTLWYFRILESSNFQYFNFQGIFMGSLGATGILLSKNMPRNSFCVLIYIFCLLFDPFFLAGPLRIIFSVRRCSLLPLWCWRIASYDADSASKYPQ